ncbi:hypothetical protein ACFLR1_00905 [Bacteroidota bacterium]
MNRLSSTSMIEWKEEKHIFILVDSPNIKEAQEKSKSVRYESISPS